MSDCLLTRKGGKGGGPGGTAFIFAPGGVLPYTPGLESANSRDRIYFLTTTNERLMYSENMGQTWQSETVSITTPGNSLRSTFSETGLTMGGNAGRVGTYIDGWSVSTGASTTITTSYAVNDVISFRRLVIAAAAGGKLATNDGSTWTARTSQFGTSAINALCEHKGRAFIFGNSNKGAYSLDGITWTLLTMPFGASRNIYRAVSFLDKLMVLNDTGEVSYSTDMGVTWSTPTKIDSTITTFASAKTPNFIVANGTLFYWGRYSAFSDYTYYYSQDGINFTNFRPANDAGNLVNVLGQLDGRLYGYIGTQSYICDVRNIFLP